MKNTQLTLALFTPGEAEKVTGLSAATQRDWRRRGFLPSRDGHNRFDVFGLSEMWALKLLSDRGIGPQAGKEVSDYLSLGIARFALQTRGAYEGDSAEIEKLPNASTPDALMAAIEKEIHRARPGEVFDLSGAPLSVLAQMNKLSQLALKQHPLGIKRVIPERYFCWFADGSHRWDEEIEKHFDTTSPDFESEKIQGPIIVMDQRALGDGLIKRAGRPLAFVEDIEDTET